MSKVTTYIVTVTEDENSEYQNNHYDDIALALNGLSDNKPFIESGVEREQITVEVQ